MTPCDSYNMTSVSRVIISAEWLVLLEHCELTVFSTINPLCNYVSVSLSVRSTFEDP